MQKRIEQLEALVFSLVKPGSAFIQLNKETVLKDTANVRLGTTTGTKIGTATTQKLAFFNATPVAQQSHITHLAEVGAAQDQDARALGNAILTRLENLGLFA